MSDSTPPSAAVRKLPVFETFRASHRVVFVAYLSSLPKISAAPFVLSLAVFALSWAINYQANGGLVPGEGEVAPGLSFASGVMNLLLVPVSLVPYVLFSVAWQRLVLLGPEAGRPRLLPSWGQRQWRSLGYVLLVMLMVYGIVLVALVPVILLWAGVAQGSAGLEQSGPLVFAVLGSFLLVVLLMLYFYARWSFVFPAVAVDEPFGLRDSWRLTRGQGSRIVATMILVLLPITLVLMVAGPLILGLISSAGTQGAAAVIFVVAFLLFYVALGYVLMALIMTAITLAFRTVSGWVPPTQAIADSFR